MRSGKEEEVYDLEIEGAHSFLTEVCAVHNRSSVITLWNRRCPPVVPPTSGGRPLQVYGVQCLSRTMWA